MRNIAIIPNIVAEAKVKNGSRIEKTFLARTKIFIIALLVTILSLLSVTAFAYDWSAGWEWWAQGAWNEGTNEYNYGCMVVAHAKLLVCAGIASSDPNVFNPQVLLDWERATGHIDSGFYNTNVEYTPIHYAATLNKVLYSGGVTYGNDACKSKIWDNIYKGYYSILWIDSGTRTGHWVLVNNGGSLTMNTIRYFESSYSTTSGTVNLGNATVNSVYTYYTDSSSTIIRGSEMSVGYPREIPDGDYMIAAAGDPQYFLDIAGGDVPAKEGTNVQLWQTESDVGDNDAWTIRYNKYNNDGFYTVSQYRQTQCLDVNEADTLNGKNVQVWGDNKGSAQQWAISKNWIQDGPGKGYRLEARCSNYSLDIADGTLAQNTNVRQWQDNMGDAQKWLFIPYKPTQTLSAGRYILLSDANTSYELDVAGDTGSISNGANVQLWSDTADSKYNSFDVKPLENGYYELIHVASGKALDVNATSTISGENIQLWDYHGGIAQQWAITPQGNGFMLRARCSGYAMDLEDGKLQNGQNVRQLFYNGSKAQTWRFVKAEYRVTYNAPEGSGVPAEQTKYYKQTLKISDTIPTRSGYRFVGWENLADLDGSMYYPGQTYSEDTGLILYAVWEQLANTITYNANGGENAPAPQTKQLGQSIALTTDIPSRRGYTFLGWATSSVAASAQYQPGDVYSTDADLTLYAVWRITNPPTLTGSDSSMLLGTSRDWRDLVMLNHDGILNYTLRAEVGGTVSLHGDQITADGQGVGTVTVTVVEYPAASCSVKVNVVDMSAVLKLPANTVSIENEAFANTGIVAVNIPAACRSIGQNAFANNESLVFAYIPTSVETIASDAFADCRNLTIFCYDGSKAQEYAANRGIRYQILDDDWVSPDEVPLGASIKAERWMYTETLTETATSTLEAMDGWIRKDTPVEWKEIGKGSYDYADFPAGFDTSHPLYAKYKVPAAPSGIRRENGVSTHKGYIFWHWTLTDEYANYFVTDVKGWDGEYDYNIFHAFETTNPLENRYGMTTSGQEKAFDGLWSTYHYPEYSNMGPWWWYRFETKTRQYTDYQRLYTYVRYTSVERESKTAVTESDTISNVRHWVKYSF